MGGFEPAYGRTTARAKKGQAFTKRVVRGGGLEPPHHCWRQDLNLVRLPISPPAHSFNKQAGSAKSTACVKLVSPLF